MPTDVHLPIQEVAQRAGVSVRTLRRRVAEGQFPQPVMRFGGKPWWRECDVTLALIAENDGPQAAHDIVDDIV